MRDRLVWVQISWVLLKFLSDLQSLILDDLEALLDAHLSQVLACECGFRLL